MYQTSGGGRAASRFAATFICCFVLAACTRSIDVFDGVTTSSIAENRISSPRERECLARAMFFESHRSSREGLVAVGTVVMNRVESDNYPDTICGVVGQKNQFAPGVMTRQMKSTALPDVMAAADDVLKGERHPAAKRAKHFHQAGLTFPYRNMHYVLEAGGNAFYERRSRRQRQAEMGAEADIDVATGISGAVNGVDQTEADTIGALLASEVRPAVGE